MSFLRYERNIPITILLAITLLVSAPPPVLPQTTSQVQTTNPTPSPQLTDAPVQAQPVSKTILPEGTPVRMRINRTVSSADAQTGDNIDFETLDDVQLGDAIVIPKGSTAMATVTEAVPKRRMARGGKLNMNIDYVRLPSSEKLPLRGIQNVKGGGHTGAMTGAMVATSIVFFPAAPLFLFMHGKDITIPKGHEVTVYTNTDYDTSKAKPPTTTSVAAPAPAPKPLSGNALTNEDIIKLKNAGLSEQLIVEKIAASPAKYQLETDDLIALKKAGLSDGIIAAMVHAGQR
ncbi:MAG TPA: hypothetical protein VKU01_31025 [Bryobacteraceae bacterium]|nr:hypothetical protein [Bryobacteraceae bacterium]